MRTKLFKTRTFYIYDNKGELAQIIEADHSSNLQIKKRLALWTRYGYTWKEGPRVTVLPCTK